MARDTVRLRVEILKAQLRDKGWTKQRLVDETRLSRSTIYNLHKRERIDRSTVDELARVLGVPSKDLAYYDEEDTQQIPSLAGLQDKVLGDALRLAAIKGHAASEVEAAFNRAYVLYREAEQLPQYYTSLQGLCFFQLIKGDLQLARALGARLLQLAEENTGHPTLQVEARVTLGAVLSFAGELLESQKLLHAAYQRYTPHMHRPSETLADSKVTCLVYMTHVWYSLGYSEQARRYIEEALRWARELAHSYSVVLTRHFGAALFQLLRDYNEAEWWATRETVQSDEIPRALWYAGGIIQEGWARVMQGKVEEGLIRMHEGMQHWSPTNASLALARWHALLAEAYGKSGQPERGLAELEKARIVMEQTGDRHYEAEVYRMMGVLELQLPNPEESQAERWFEKALEVARRQQAKSLELRTAIDQSKFWQRQGKREEAYTLLAPIYGWFTEGFDTVDLQEAKTLLETLAS